MSTTIHLCNGNILCSPRNELYSRSITIVDGIIVNIDSQAPSGVRSLDLQGKTVVPGFVDSHLHLVQGASGMGTVQLHDIDSLGAFNETLKEAVSCNEQGQWIVASGWSSDNIGVEPVISLLDVVGDIPTICVHNDFHSAFLNRALISKLDVLQIECMVGGERILEGIVKEDALFQGVLPYLPAVPILEKIAQTKQVVSQMHSEGITLLGTMENLVDTQNVLVPIQETQRIRMRIMCLEEPNPENCYQCKTMKEDSFLKITGFKAFFDGSLGSRTAKMYAPWHDVAGDGVWAGIAEQGNCKEWVRAVTSHGYAPVIHAIGDCAVGKALDAIEDVDTKLIPRIEHAQFIADRDMHKLEGKWFGVQPVHQPDDEKVAVQAVGHDRAAQLHNWRRMLDAGAQLSFGSDWPVAPMRPLDGMSIAIKQGLTPKESLVASTQDAADSLHSPKAGRLELGSYGDAVVLDYNPLDCDWDVQIPSVAMTIVNGNIVYEKE